MARPAFDASERRNVRIVFRVTPEEETAIRDRVRLAQSSFADYSRAMLIAGPMFEIRYPYFCKKYTFIIEKILVNLEQLLRHAETAHEHRKIVILKDRLRHIFETRTKPDVPKKFVEESVQAKRKLFLRVTADQREVIEARAEDAGLQLSQFSRTMLLEGRVSIERYLDIDPDLMNQLHQLGKELNTVTRQANIKDYIPTSTFAIMVSINQVLDQGVEC